MLEQEILDRASSLMKQCKVCFLSTVNGTGFPETRAMLNLRNPIHYPNLEALFVEEGLTLYFSTNTSSDKVAQMRRNSVACVYFVDESSFVGLMLQGRVEVLNDAPTQRRIWQQGWEMYYPQGPEDPDHTVLRIRPERLEMYMGFRAYKLDLVGAGE